MELQHHYAMVSFPSQDMANSSIPRRQAHKLNLKPCFVEFSQIEFEVLHVTLLTHQTSHLNLISYVFWEPNVPYVPERFFLHLGTI